MTSLMDRIGDPPMLNFDNIIPINADAEERRKDEFVTVSGVVLKLHKVKGSIIREIVLKIEEPSIPRIEIKEDERWEENPADPSYQIALRKYNIQTSTATTGAYLILGTSLKSKPDDVDGPDDDWHLQYEELGVVVRNVGTKSRYFDWLKYLVLETDAEFIDLVAAIMKFSGTIKEDDVLVAENSFPDNEERDTDNGDSPT